MSKSESQREDRSDLERRHSGDPDANPGNISGDPEPHHTLNNPAGDPDPTEWPDPYEKRKDPRDPAAVDTPADPTEDEEEPRPNPRAPSTSDPPGPDWEQAKPVKGDHWDT
jgi:hypothetical protein